jgi:hypothetical protein
VIEAGQALYRERTELVARAAAADTRFAESERKLAELDREKGEHYRRALEEYRAFLAGQDAARLDALARSTETRSDDGWVERIADIDRQWERARERVTALGRERAEAARRLSELRQVETEFRRRDWDASNSRFGRGLDLEDLLVGLLLGKLTSGGFGEAIGGHQRFRKRGRSSSGGGAVLRTGGSIARRALRTGGGFLSRGRFSSGGGF